ncbi:MAG TPA: hypothetical protein VK994_05015 [Bacteroidales bacterium]|nr:hypothetical protein [Bacteroidales bacterium]
MKKLIITISILINCFIVVIAQNSEAEAKGKIPSLNGHTFPNPILFKYSFISTSFHASFSYAKTNPIIFRGIKIGQAEAFEIEGQIVLLGVNVEYQQKFNNWLALRMSFMLTGRLGTEVNSILADGVNTFTGGEIGWLIRIMQNKKLNLSASVNVQNLTGNFINVSRYIQDIIDQNPNPAVIHKVPSLNVSAGVLGAYAFSPTFGIQFQGEYAYGESFTRESGRGYYLAGILGDVDFMPRYEFPVGLSLGYTFSSAPNIVMSEGGMAHLYSSRIRYTGAKDFDLGLQYSFYTLEFNNIEDKPMLNSATLLLKFYF